MDKPLRNLRMGNAKSVHDTDYQYDSTWDEEDDEGYVDKVKTKPSKQLLRPVHRNLQAARDMQMYRHIYQSVSRMVPPKEVHVCYQNQVSGQGQSRDRQSKFPEPHTSRFGDRTPSKKPSQRHKQREETAYKTQHTKRSYDQEYCSRNLQFYQNKIPSQPDGVYIDDFHMRWYGDYVKLEGVHSYIQWLFPLQEKGMNQFAQALSSREIIVFRKDKEMTYRFFKSYNLMLDFYGINLLSERTGEVERAVNWEARFDNLNRNTHNNLRITRILKCLGLLGFEHYQAPLVKFFLEETLVRGTLPRVKQSVLDYFMFSVVDKNERKKLVKFAIQHYVPREEFMWCPEWIQMKLLGMNPHKVYRSDQLTEQQRSVPQHRKQSQKWKNSPSSNKW